MEEEESVAFPNDTNSMNDDVPLTQHSGTKRIVDLSKVKIPRRISIALLVLVAVFLGYIFHISGVGNVLSRVPRRPKLPIIQDLSKFKYLDSKEWSFHALHPKDRHTEKNDYPSISTAETNKKNMILCKLGGSAASNSYCQTKYISELVDYFYVICPIYKFGKANDELLYSRHVDFVNAMKSLGITVVTYEAIKKGSNETYLMTRPNNEPYEMQGYYHNISYIRENLLNLAIKNIKKEWQYVAWIDAHQIFQNKYWWEEGIYKSEHYAMVQLFEESFRFDMNNQTIKNGMGSRVGFFRLSFMMHDMFKYRRQIEFGNAHMLSWESYTNNIGYIHDECFASGCDWAYVQASLPPGGSHYLLEHRWPRYNSTHQEWLYRVLPKVHGSRAFIPGKVIHLDHGTSSFSYIKLRTIVDTADYNFTRDVHRDENGVIYISNEAIAKAVEAHYLSSN